MPEQRVLVFASYYLPGFLAGGPVRSLSRLFEWLQGEFDFQVVTRNRDLGVTAPYPDKEPGRWYPAGTVDVTYLARPCSSVRRLRGIVREVRPDLLYFNSAVDPCLSILPLLLRRFGLLGPAIPALVAPRGEFSPGALGLKRLKKTLWLALARFIGVYSTVTWHATDEHEAGFIRRTWGSDARILVAPNLPPRHEGEAEPDRQPKEAGVLRAVFLSRISPMKNLRGVLTSLASVRAPVSLHIYGAREDPEYWAACEQEIGRLPAHVKVEYRGVVAPDDVIPTLARYDLFFLPTLGENFGHVILEALLAGCPVLISDRTPWRDLEAGQAGLDVPLGNEGLLVGALERFAAMDDPEFRAWSRGARQRGLSYCQNRGLGTAARGLLQGAMRQVPEF